MDESQTTETQQSMAADASILNFAVDDLQLDSQEWSQKRKADELNDDRDEKPRIMSPTKSGVSYRIISRTRGCPVDVMYKEPSPIPPETCAGLAKDPNYFMEDGNLVLLVHDTYFKVHQSRLAQDSSIFSDMFRLPQSGTVEGQSLEQPIRLAEKPRRFASLMWALYALPAQLKDISRDTDNVSKLIDVATAAQKYQFRTTEEWALTCLVDLVLSHNQIHFRKVNPWRIFAVANLCNSNALRAAMVSKIKDKAASGSLPYSWVVTIAENLCIKELLGEGYYRLVIKGYERWNEDQKLSETMVQKLYVGFCRLVTFRDKLFIAPFDVLDHNCALGPGPCRARWVAVWKEGHDECRASHFTASVDVIGQLKNFLNWLRRHRVYPGPCSEAWCATVEEKISQISDAATLAEFFKPREI